MVKRQSVRTVMRGGSGQRLVGRKAFEQREVEEPQKKSVQDENRRVTGEVIDHHNLGMPRTDGSGRRRERLFGRTGRCFFAIIAKSEKSKFGGELEVVTGDRW